MASSRDPLVNEVMFAPATMSVLHELIPRIAKKRLAVYRGVPGEDLEAECWLAAVEDAEAINALVAEDATSKVEARLTRAAVTVQGEEERDQRARKAAAAGYRPADECFYSLAALRALLPAWLDGGVTETPPQGREGSAGAKPPATAQYGEWLTSMVDLDAAMAAIRPHHRDTLETYFQFPADWTLNQIAGALGKNPETVRKAVYRALRAVQAELGGTSPYTRSRLGCLNGLALGGRGITCRGSFLFLADTLYEHA